MLIGPSCWSQCLGAEEWPLSRQWWQDWRVGCHATKLGDLKQLVKGWVVCPILSPVFCLQFSFCGVFVSWFSWWVSLTRLSISCVAWVHSSQHRLPSIWSQNPTSSDSVTTCYHQGLFDTRERRKTIRRRLLSIQERKPGFWIEGTKITKWFITFLEFLVLAPSVSMSKFQEFYLLWTGPRPPARIEYLEKVLSEFQRKQAAKTATTGIHGSSSLLESSFGAKEIGRCMVSKNSCRYLQASLQVIGGSHAMGLQGWPTLYCKCCFLSTVNPWHRAADTEVYLWHSWCQGELIHVEASTKLWCGPGADMHFTR